MFEWINANWQGIALVFFILYSVASEAIGISNLKENAVIQLLSGYSADFAGGFKWIL